MSFLSDMGDEIEQVRRDFERKPEPVTPDKCPVTAHELREISEDCTYAARCFVKKAGDIKAYYAHGAKLRALADWLEKEGSR